MLIHAHKEGIIMRRKGIWKKLVFVLSLVISIVISAAMTKLIFNILPSIPDRWTQLIFFACLIIIGGISAFVSGKITRK